MGTSQRDIIAFKDLTEGIEALLWGTNEDGYLRPFEIGIRRLETLQLVGDVGDFSFLRG